MIVTANSWFKCSFDTYKQMQLMPDMMRHGINKLPDVSTADPLTAFVNHGRWIVVCECGGAEFAWEEGLFMCRSCFNAKHKHNLRRSVFPAAKAEIERLLVVRPLPNRNWLPYESVESLGAENAEHKDELLEVN